MTSLVHNRLAAPGQLGAFDDNRPKAVRCVHPLVTLLEKLDVLHRRVPNEKSEPPDFVRHFEDAVRIIAAEALLPVLPDYDGARSLADDLLRQKQIAALPRADDVAFALRLKPLDGLLRGRMELNLFLRLAVGLASALRELTTTCPRFGSCTAPSVG